MKLQLPQNRIKPPIKMERIRGYNNLFDFLIGSGHDHINNPYDWNNFFEEIRDLRYHMISFDLDEVGSNSSSFGGLFPRKYSIEDLDKTIDQMIKLNEKYSWIHISRELNKRDKETRGVQ